MLWISSQLSNYVVVYQYHTQSHNNHLLTLKTDSRHGLHWELKDVYLLVSFPKEGNQEPFLQPLGKRSLTAWLLMAIISILSTHENTEHGSPIPPRSRSLSNLSTGHQAPPSVFWGLYGLFLCLFLRIGGAWNDWSLIGVDRISRVFLRAMINSGGVSGNLSWPGSSSDGQVERGTDLFAPAALVFDSIRASWARFQPVQRDENLALLPPHHYSRP